MKLIRVALVVTLVLFAASAVQATSLYRPVPEETFSGPDMAPWAFIERHSDPHPRFPWEPFVPKLVQFYPQVVKAFGTSQPHSRSFLLHAMPGWDAATKPYPVLLLPGSNDDSSRRYAYPLSTTHPDHLKRTGLGVYLAQRGFSVFAISFSHFHGCNVHQGEQVANAITRIRELLGRQNDPDFKVDLITYSKGAMAARCYVESAGEMLGLRYLTPFRNDVRRVVFQVGPIGGMDMPFRYYLYNLSCKSNDLPAPLGVSSQVIYGVWKDSGIEDMFSGYWPGQLQMMHDQRELGVPYGPLSFTADANLSMAAIRDGGSSFFVRSHGLEAARNAGGNLIELLNTKGFPKGVSASLVAGNHPVLYNENVHNFQIPIGAELSGKSDGLLFLKSATYTKGLTAQGATITGVKVFPLNHVEISRSDEAFAYVTSQLDLP